MHNIQGARLWSFQDIFALLSKINYERIYQENELQSSGTIQYTFQSLVVWEYLIWPIYSWHAITVTKYNVGLGVTCLCLLVTGTIPTLCLLEMVSISRLSFLLQTTTLSIRFHTDSPFFNFFFTISLRFSLRSPRKIVQMYVFCFEKCWQALQNCKNCTKTLNILFTGNIPSVWGQLLRFVLSHGCHGTVNHFR